MKVTSIALRHVRAHINYTLAVSPSVTLITGSNGSGKTTLIEALHVALRGTSFKGSDNDILQSGAPWYRIDIAFDDQSLRTVKFDPGRATGKKQFEFDSKTHYRLTHAHKYPVVLFEPEDLRLLNGSPTRRRDFIDNFITQLDPEYATAIRRYDRALKQRNSLLKRAVVHDDDLFAWNIALSQYGAHIIEKRVHFVGELNSKLNAVYSDISHTHDEVAVAYSHASSSANLQQKLLADLHECIERDRIVGYTSVGPHRHDVLFTFNNSPALSVASRGEVRTIVLALKFLEVSFIELLTGKKPIILLDDVFSELDAARQKYLVESTKDNQIIITSATNNSKIPSEHIRRL
jgi:DNA replication and repair protein RecF